MCVLSLADSIGKRREEAERKISLMGKNDLHIIDFHTHPFAEKSENIQRYRESGREESIVQAMERAGISMICGSVLHIDPTSSLQTMLISNAHALALYQSMPSFYMPGVQIDPHHVNESCEALAAAHRAGVRLVGEINPKRMQYEAYSWSPCVEILQYAQELGMVVSCHSTTEEDMDMLAAALPQLMIVNAHPGESARLANHIARMKQYENVHLDLSGTGLFRLGMLRHLINEVGKDRILFGTDFPVCNPAMYVEGVLYERLTSSEQEAVFSGNATRLLQL